MTPSKMPIKITILLVFLAQSFLVHSQGNKSGSNTYNYLIEPGKAEGLLTLKGRVLDQSKQGVPFVNIGIRGTLHGTAADDEGYFILKLPQNLENEVVTISCVGFQSMALPVTELKQKYQFVLDDDISQLAEIEVKSERISARDVIKEVIKRIPQNYSQQPFTQFKHYRQKVQGRDGEFFLYEKITEEYDDDGYESTPMHGLKKRESFRIVHLARIGRIDSAGKVSDYKNASIDIPTPTAWADVVNSRFNNFLSKSKQRKYDFQFNERGLLNSDTIFIDFNIDNPGHRSTTVIGPIKFSGTILIDASNYAVLEVHSNAVIDKEKVWRSQKKPRYETESVWWEKEIVKYKRIEGHHFLSSIIRRSNYDLDTKGFIEIEGLNVKVGEREAQGSSFKPIQEYDLEKWKDLIQSDQ